MLVEVEKLLIEYAEAYEDSAHAAGFIMQRLQVDTRYEDYIRGWKVGASDEWALPVVGGTLHIDEYLRGHQEGREAFVNARTRWPKPRT